jgi:Tat protein translocase TatB subunit
MLSIPHLIIIFLVALVVLGPEKLPEVARVLGKVMSEFRKVTTDFKSALETEMNEIDRQAREKERLAREAAARPPAVAPPMAALPEAAPEAAQELVSGSENDAPRPAGDAQAGGATTTESIAEPSIEKHVEASTPATGGSTVEPASNGESHPA